MRTFEIVLILVNLITLFVPVRQQARFVWHWSTGVNLAVLGIHGIVEGVRYQMAFSYTLVVLFLILTILPSHPKSGTNTRAYGRAYSSVCLSSCLHVQLF